MTPEALLIEKQSYNALAIEAHSDYRKLDAFFKQYGTWTAAYKTNPPQTESRERAWKKLELFDIRIILPTETEFPELLKQIPWRPHALYIVGAPLKNEMKLAIVGTRKATGVGLTTAKKFATELAQSGITIVSGMALGIDTAAHEGALAASGKTIAILACGLDTFYPRQNDGLAKRILKNGGSIISEYPPGSPALQQRFLERNRITSGLCLGTIVVESPIKSGVRATVRFAIEQNRETLVVPGAVSNPNYAGSHELIRSGATLITNTTEILEHFAMKPKDNLTLFAQGAFDKLEKKHRIILQALQESGMPLTADELLNVSKLTVNEIAEALTLLTIDGIIKEENGTYFIL